ncbi:MAG: AzlD domain-containing protein [Chloroflexi bacterium]|jgi:branched-subunit amino acid transport protein|nr:AzlD domain-containing protein [Chloroflexota bacterium]
MNLWLIIIGMGVITYTIRLSMIVMSGQVQLSDQLQRALRYVPPAVLSAIILPEMVQPGGTLDISLGNERLLAGLIAIVVAWYTQNMIWTVAIGMITLWLLQAITS